MNVKGIIIAWLKANSFEGLYNPEGECGCKLDDLAPCDSDCMMVCKPGYYVKAHENDSEDYDYYIMASKLDIADYLKGFE